LVTLAAIIVRSIGSWSWFYESVSAVVYRKNSFLSYWIHKYIRPKFIFLNKQINVCLHRYSFGCFLAYRCILLKGENLSENISAETEIYKIDWNPCRHFDSSAQLFCLIASISSGRLSFKCLPRKHIQEMNQSVGLDSVQLLQSHSLLFCLTKSSEPVWAGWSKKISTVFCRNGIKKHLWRQWTCLNLVSSRDWLDQTEKRNMAYCNVCFKCRF
jgi:hypothetical protein